MGSKRSVWVSVGKTHHQAWLLGGVVHRYTDQVINQKCNDEQVLIQWESVRYTEWVPRSSVHFEIPSVRRRPAKKSETRSSSQYTDFLLTKNTDCVLQHSDMTTFMCPNRPQPILKTTLKQKESFNRDGVACFDEELVVKTPRVLEFSNTTLESDANTISSAEQMKSSCQHGNSATTDAEIDSKATETHHEPEETQTCVPVASGAACTAKDFRKEIQMGKNIHKSKQNIKFKSKHKSFTLRDLEQDGNFTETQLRVFNELLTGKILFSPPSLKKLRRTLASAKHNQKSFFLRNTVKH